MKTNTKKLLLGLGLAMIGNFSFAQGLEGIYVEKYYQADAADVSNASSNGAVVPLTTNSVTYRVYVDMAAGYKFNSLYGNAAHNLTVNSTTNFYNDPTYGVSVNPYTISATNYRKNTAMLDSWFATGGVGAKVGLPKSEDTDGTVGSAQSILANNPGGCFGSPITGSGAADGMMPLVGTTYVAPNTLGLGTSLDPLDQTAGNSIVINNGTIAALGGIVGLTSSNRVLVAQFTTTGNLSFALNVQIQNIATGIAENWVSSNPTGSEQTLSSLTLTANTPPSISLTSPSNGAAIITNTATNFTATASDNVSVTDVKFYLDGALFATDATSPYSAAYTAANGSHTLYAIATDGDCAATQTSTINFTVAPNQAPSVSVSAPTTAIEQDVVNITATASDADGSVTQVEFLIDDVVVSTDASSPYAYSWTATAGSHTIKARATDNLGLAATSSVANIAVAVNTPPTAAITSPLASATYIAPAAVIINATASDADGTVTQVEFFVNGASVGVDASSPYSYTWTSVPGTASLTVKSTDNKGAITTSSAVVLSIADPNALPYEIGIVSQPCDQTTFCVPLSVAVTAPVDNVKGYDVVLNYNAAKVTPTGNITLYGDLINTAYIEEAHAIDAVNGKMTISVYFKGSAPSTAEFNGTGKIFCVEFNKTGSFASTDTSLFTTSFLQESYITGVAAKTSSTGKAITYRNENYAGLMKFWLDNSPIKYNAALPNAFLISKVRGADTVTNVVNNSTFVTPDVNGSFTHVLTNGLGLNFERNVSNTATVQLIINAADAVLGKTLLLNDAVTFTPSIYQILALDVNLDGVVSAGDISQIKQRATLNIGEYQQAWNYSAAGVSNGSASKDWVFVDTLKLQSSAYQISTTFPANDLVGYSKYKVPVVPFVLPARVSGYANCPVSDTMTYKGIMLGDVDGNYAAYTADGVLKSATSKVILDLDNAVVNGSTVEVPVSIVSNEPVNALDIAFQYNEDKMTYSTLDAVNADVDGFAFFNESDRTLRYTAIDMDNFVANNTIAKVTFNNVAGKINADDFINTLGLLNGKPVTVEFSKSALTINEETSNFASIYPNPTKGLLNIVASQNSTVQIMNITGQQVLTQFDVNANEKTTIDMNEFSNGVYFVQISNGQFSKTERVVVSK